MGDSQDAGGEESYDDNWLEAVIDSLSSEYGWTKDYILERIYPEESLVYLDKIDSRRRNDYLMQLAIVTNPALKPDNQKNLWDILSQRDSREISTKTILDDRIDKQGVTSLKHQLTRSKSRIKVK
jgi:hypothetical protein